MNFRGNQDQILETYIFMLIGIILTSFMPGIYIDCTVAYLQNKM